MRRLALLIGLLVSSTVQAGALMERLQAVIERQAMPEAATGRYPLSTAEGRRQMVVTAHPLATEAALQVLRDGGSAVDAAITAQAVLGLVEPQSSGFGGGAFIVHARQGEVMAVDGRETAPAAASPDRFTRLGLPMLFDQALGEGRAIGVPGVVAALDEAHRRWGKLPWSRLLAPAIQLADNGFPVSDRLSRLSGGDRLIPDHPALRQYLLDADGKAWPPGTRLRNPAYARLLRTLAGQGPAAFYRGPLAAKLVAGARAAGSDLTLADWSGYRARVSPALCAPVKKVRVCSAPPPAGGLSVIEGLSLWSRAPAALPFDHALLEAERLAFADRQRYSADPAFVPVPVAGLLANDYLDARALRIGEQASKGVTAGVPTGASLALATDRQLREQGTTHLAVVDRQGHWLAMTSSIEDAFGSRLLVEGLLLNNQLTDFSFVPEQDGRAVANRVQPGKRPRSAMSPTVALDGQGHPVFSVGSPGGGRIIGFVTGVLARWLAGEQDPGRLVSAPIVLARQELTEVELGYPAARLAALKAREHDVMEREMASGLAVITREGDRLLGAADPRREGRAAGD